MQRGPSLISIQLNLSQHKPEIERVVCQQHLKACGSNTKNAMIILVAQSDYINLQISVQVYPDDVPLPVVQFPQ